MRPFGLPVNNAETMDHFNFSTQNPSPHHHWRHHNHSHLRESHKHNSVVDVLSSSIIEVLNSKFSPENSVLPDMEPLSTHMESFDHHYKMNSSENRSDDGEHIYRHGGAMTAVCCVAYLLVFLVGMIGNCFVIAVVCRSPRMRTVTNFFIVNLAIADILVIVFCLPATLMSNIFIREY